TSSRPPAPRRGSTRPSRRALPSPCRRADASSVPSLLTAFLFLHLLHLQVRRPLARERLLGDGEDIPLDVPVAVEHVNPRDPRAHLLVRDDHVRRCAVVPAGAQVVVVTVLADPRGLVFLVLV